MNRKLILAGVMGVTLFVGSIAMTQNSTAKPPSSKDTEIRRVDVGIEVPASLREVWHAWTTNEGVQTFFARRTNVKLAVEGPFEMLFLEDAPTGQQGSEGCKFLSYLPYEMLSFTWNAPPQFKHARGRHTWVVVRFEELSPHRTKVKLTHLGWDERIAEFPTHRDEWVQVQDYFSEAWLFVLDQLKKRFEDGPRWGTQ